MVVTREVGTMSGTPIVVGVDRSEISKRALRWAIEYAGMKGAPVEALIGWDVPVTYGMPVLFDEAELKDRASQALHETISQMQTESVVVTERVEKGHAGNVLVAASQHAQLLVIGGHDHHHHRMPARSLGSVGLHCVQHAHCPVVVIRDT
jgi:nucleotide-binding universal stress UspA family protein